VTAISVIGRSPVPANHVLGRKLDSIPFSLYHMLIIGGARAYRLCWLTRARVALPRAIWAGIYGKRRLREIDRRIRFLSARLESAEGSSRSSRRSWTRSSSARPSPKPTGAGTKRPSQSSESTRPISAAVR